MVFSAKQRGVVQAMMIGAVFSIALICLGIFFNPFNFASNFSLESKISILFKSLSPIAICLAFAIARIAKHRFFSIEDIDGSGLRPGSERAILLQSLLQNTLEQSVLAALVYAIWVFLMPSTWLSVVPLATASFTFGRVLFFIGYRRGAPGRALGFTMGFYPTVAMLTLICFKSLS